MTHPELVKLENLVQRLDEGMKRTSDDLDEKLFAFANEYQAQCQRANDRLQTCAEILSGGPDREYQALMSATHPPDILDFCAILSELQTEEYRAYCKRNHLPAADHLNERAKQQIDPIYAKGGSFQSKLMAEFSAANSLRNLPEALRVIRQVSKLNPSDASARKQAGELEDRLILIEIKEMEPALKAGNEEEVLALLGKVEQLAPGRIPDENEPGAKIWNEALTLRKAIWREQAEAECEEILPEAQTAKEANDLNLVLGLIGNVANLMREHEFTLRPNDRTTLSQLEEWSSEEVRKLKVEDEFQVKLDELREAIRTIRNKEFQSAKPTLDELREDKLVIERTWKEIFDFRKPVPNDLQDDAKKLLGELTDNISLKEKAKRRNLIAILTSSSLILLALAICALFFWKASQATELLRKAIAEERARDLEKRITELESTQPVWMIFGGVAGEMARGKTWIENQKAVAARVEAQIAGLESEMKTRDSGAWTPVTLASTKRSLEEAETKSSEVNEDYRSGFADRISSLTRQRQAAADEKRNLIVSEFHESVVQLEGDVRDKLGFEKSPAEIGSAVKDMAPLVAKMDTLAAPELEELAPSSADLTKYGILREKFAAAELELGKAREIMSSCKNATSLEEYASTARDLLSTDFLNGSQKIHLGNLLLAIGSNEKFLRQILVPGDISFWTLLSSGDLSTEGYPETAEGGEKVVFLGLRDDDALSKIFRHPITQNGKKRDIFSIGKKMAIRVSTLGDVTKIDAKGERVYDPKDGEEVEFREAVFQERSSPTGSAGYAPPKGDISPESRFYKSLNIGSYMDAGVTNYRKSFLRVLDRISTAPSDLNPLFLAYVHMEVGNLVTSRRAAWLLEFNEAESDLVRLKGIVGRELKSDDWCSTPLTDEFSTQLAGFYESLGETRYEKTSKTVNDFYARMINAGVSYSGFVDMVGGTEVNAGGKDATTLWGLDESLKIAPLFEKSEEGSYIAINKAAAFSPLVRLNATPEEVLKTVSDATGIDPHLPGIQKHLPERYRTTD